MITKSAVTIDAEQDRVWSVFTDVEHWPDWTPSVSAVEVVTGTGVELGTRVRIKQPRLPTMIWEVTSVEGPTGWSWVARSPGATTVAHHQLTALAPGSTQVEQTIEQHGVLGRLAGLFTRRLTQRYLEMEGLGLKSRCESIDA